MSANLRLSLPFDHLEISVCVKGLPGFVPLYTLEKSVAWSLDDALIQLETAVLYLKSLGSTEEGCSCSHSGEESVIGEEPAVFRPKRISGRRIVK